MKYDVFEIVVNKRTIAYCSIDKENNKFGYIPVEDESLATVLKYIVDEPIMSLTVSLDNGLCRESFEPKDDLFLKALAYHLPRKYKVSNLHQRESDKNMKSFLRELAGYEEEMTA